jgi:hypothetical protein
MTRPHEYVDCEIPEGMTLREYHAARRPDRKPRRRHGLVARLRRRQRDARRAAAR